MSEGPRKTIWSSGWLVMAIGLLVLLTPFSATFQHNGGPMDEGTLLVYPEMIQRGAIPYRDFETFYGPANPYLLAGVYAIFGTNIDVERTVGLLYRAVILVAVFGLTRRFGTAIATGCMLVAGFLLLVLGVVAYAWFGAMACALCFIWVMARPVGNWRCMMGGLLAGLALTFRLDMGPAVILAAWVLLHPLSSSQRLRFALGAAIALMPFAVLLLLCGPEQMFNNLFLYPVILSGPGRRLPLFSAEPYLVRIFFAEIAAAAANVVVWFLAVRARPEEWGNRVLLALALLGAGVMPQAWQRLDIYHLMFVAFLILGIFPLTLFSIASQRMAQRASVRWALGAIFVVAAFISAIAPQIPQLAVICFREGLQTTPSGIEFVQRGGRSFPVVTLDRLVATGRLLNEIERLSKPGERLFIGPGNLRRTNYCDTYLYHLLPELRPATYFLEMNPGSANRPGSRLASDIMTADWVILNHEWDFGNEPNRSSEDGPTEAADRMRAHFRLVGHYGAFAILRRKL